MMVAGRRIEITFCIPVLVLGLVAGQAPAQNTTRVSVDSSGNEANSQSYDPALSENGRFVAFTSTATNLVPGDTNGQDDVFFHDRLTGLTTLISVNTAGVQGNAHSYRPALTPDARLVAFDSGASNLSGGNNGWLDVFVHDRQTGETAWISMTPSGGNGNANSSDPSISADGQVVAFAADATNLVQGGDANGWESDVYVRDRKARKTSRVSVSSAGVQGDDPSTRPSISADGRWVVFESTATNLVPGDTNGVSDVFLHDLQTAVTTRVSVDSSGGQANGASARPALSADGLFVVFASDATNLVPGDTQGARDVFVHDLQSGVTTRVSIDSSGQAGNGASDRPKVTADGRTVAFNSQSTNLVAGDTNGAEDSFVHDRLTGRTTRASVSTSGSEGDDSSLDLAVSVDGRSLMFISDASNLVPGDTNGWQDAFIHGPSLTLEASPDTVTTGDAITLTTWGGLPFGLAFLYAVDFNGSPTLIKVTKGPFDANGLWALAATVPPGLSGNVVTFQALGLAPTGGIELTNREVVTFN